MQHIDIEHNRQIYSKKRGTQHLIDEMKWTASTSRSRIVSANCLMTTILLTSGTKPLNVPRILP